MIRILLAEDENITRQGLKTLISLWQGFEVVGAAADGKAAIEAAHQLKPDVIVMDVKMPNLDGIEAARLICETLPKTGIVMLSVRDDMSYATRALQAGARGYVLKACNEDELQLAIRTVHQGERYLDKKLKSLFKVGLQSRARHNPASLDGLSPREIEVLEHLAARHSRPEIADLLAISPKTVDRHRDRLMDKLGIRNPIDLVLFMIRAGLITLDDDDDPAPTE